MNSYPPEGCACLRVPRFDEPYTGKPRPPGLATTPADVNRILMTGLAGALAADERALRHALCKLPIKSDERLFSLVASQQRELVS